MDNINIDTKLTDNNDIKDNNDIINEDNNDIINEENDENDSIFNEEEYEEDNKELYKIVFDRTKEDDNFDDYLVEKKKCNQNKKNKTQLPKNNKYILLSSEKINKRQFNPRLPPPLNIEKKN